MDDNHKVAAERLESADEGIHTLAAANCAKCQLNCAKTWHFGLFGVPRHFAVNTLEPRRIKASSAADPTWHASSQVKSTKTHLKSFPPQHIS